MKTHSILGIAAILICSISQASAQKTATEAPQFNRTVLPIAPGPFKGTMGLGTKESKPSLAYSWM